MKLEARLPRVKQGQVLACRWSEGFPSARRTERMLRDYQNYPRKPAGRGAFALAQRTAGAFASCPEAEHLPKHLRVAFLLESRSRLPLIGTSIAL
jgi:hypothetical protein